MKVGRMLGLAGIAVTATVAAAQVPQTQGDLDAIRRVVTQYQQALNDNDLDAAMALYAPDAVYMPDGGPTQVGKDEIRTYYLRRNIFGQSDRRLTFNPFPLIVSADYAIVRTEISGTTRPEAGATPRQVSSKSVFILRRLGDGSWKIALYIFNASD